MELRLKNLAKTKAYRDAFSGVREREKVIRPRKRVIIAPSMASVDERACNLGSMKTEATQRASRDGREIEGRMQKQIPDTGGLNDLNSYKAWVKERKQLRKDLNQCGLVYDWLESKPSLTEIEQRVQDAQPITSDRISRSTRMRTSSNDNRLAKGASNTKYPPAINQPLPVALATINEYLAKKRLRFYDLFVQADRDKDWKVSRDEFKDIMKRTGIPLKDAEIDQFVQALDSNNNDVLEYKEFAHGREMLILSERTKKHPEYEPSVLTSDSSEKQHEEEALNTDDAEIDRQISHQSVLSLPEVMSSDHIFTTKDQDNEKRSRRQKKREKHRQKIKSSEKIDRELCTMGGVTGMLVDTFQRQKQSEYERILELCHLHGVTLSKNLLERVLLHPEDRSLDKCISSLRPRSRYLPSEEELYRKLIPSNADTATKHFTKSKRKISFYSYHVYPPAASVTPKVERMNLSSGSANISRKADCWMTYEEYYNLTRHLDSRFEKSWKPTEENPYWPSYVFDKVRLYLERPRTQVRSENSIFDIIHNKTIH